MRIFIIGATGATRQQIIDRGLAQGHEITAAMIRKEQAREINQGDSVSQGLC
jgi:putative NADH-flavin reductase